MTQAATRPAVQVERTFHCGGEMIVKSRTVLLLRSLGGRITENSPSVREGFFFFFNLSLTFVVVVVRF